MSDREYIRISLHLARHLVQQATLLFTSGTGAPLVMGEHEDIEDFNGIMDDIPIDSEAWQWSQTLLGFARFVAQMIQRELDEQGILTITDNEDL